jgi:hypothetical protein
MMILPWCAIPPPAHLPPTFGSGGIVTTNISSGDDFAGSIAIQEGGKNVVAGSANNGSDDDFALAGYFIYLPLVLNNDSAGLFPPEIPQVE